jgi:hypothetical protein
MSAWKHIRTCLLVSVIAAGVWVFAEAETVRGRTVTATLLLRPAPAGSLPSDGPHVLTLVATQERVSDGDGIDEVSESRKPAIASSAVRLTATDPLSVLQVPGTVAVQVELQLRGTGPRVDEVQRELRDALDVSFGSSALVPMAEGELEVDVSRVMAGLSLFVESGVTIQRATPALVVVRQEQLVTRDMPIAVTAAGVDLQGRPQVQPTLARVTMPRSLASALAFSPEAKVVLGPRDVERATPGERVAIAGLAVQPPAEVAGRAFVSVEPASADVSVVVRSRTAELTLRDVPVRVQMSAADMERFGVRVQPAHATLSTVRVVGPASEVAKLEQRQAWQPVVGVVALSTAELEMGVDSKEVTFADSSDTLRFEPSLVVVPIEVVRR